MFGRILNNVGINRGGTSSGGVNSQWYVADLDPSLPPAVRQLLQLTNSAYETNRITRARLNWRYYKNTQYEAEFLNIGDGEPASVIQQKKELWAGIKPLFNLITLSVDVDKRLIFKKGRPLPLVRDDVLEQRLTAKWERDGWFLMSKRAALYSAVMGVTYLRVIPGDMQDNPDAPSRLEAYSPEIMSILRDQHDHKHVLAAKIEYQYAEWDNSPNLKGVGGPGEYYSIYSQRQIVGLSARESLHTRTIIITEDAYYTFRDHALIEEVPNNLGLVPVIEVRFNDIGEDAGLPTFASIMDTCDRINELASMFGNMVLMNADPILVGYGIPNKNIKKTLQEDGSTYIYVPLPPPFQGTNQSPHMPKMEYLSWKGESIPALKEFLAMVKLDAERSMPETLWGNNTQRTGSGYEAAIDKQPLVEKIEDARETHFDALEDAIQMALVADDARGEVLAPGEARARIEDARVTYDLHIVADPVLPLDRAALAQERSVDLADKIITVRQARLERGFTFTEVDDQEKQDEIEHQTKLRRLEEELKLYAKYAIAVKPPGAPAPPAPDGGGPQGGAVAGPNIEAKPSNATLPTISKSGKLLTRAPGVKGGVQPKARPNGSVRQNQ